MPPLPEMISLTWEIIVEPVADYGGDWLICDAARVSAKGAVGRGPRDLSPADLGLLRNLIEKRHGAPFQHGGLTFYTEAPIFVFREWRTHRVYMHQITDDMSYSEASARYRGAIPKFWIPAPSRNVVKAEGFRAMEPSFTEPIADYEAYFNRKHNRYQTLWDDYRYEVEKLGHAPEVASRSMPVAQYSAMYVSCNPRSLMHFLSLRTHEPTATFVSYPQAEIETAARGAEEIFASGWPETFRLWNDAGRHSV